MKILVGSLTHESNTFVPLLTPLEDFTIVYGPDSLDMPGNDAFAGIVHTLRAEEDVELVPTLWANALPGGRVERAAYNEFKHVLLSKARGVDGVCLFLHGAMRAEGVDYCEDDLLAALREELGPHVPITVALDMHANVVARMARNADALVAYHTAPHIDIYETGEKAADLLLRILREGTRPQVGFAKVPMLLPGELAQTAWEPMASVMRLVEEIEGLPGVISASFIKTHCWADVPDQGLSAIVVTDADAALAQREADRLVSFVWEHREEFQFSVETLPVEAVLDAALAAPESTVFLSDAGDNPTAGGLAEIPLMLDKLLARHVSNAVIAAIWDPVAVDVCLGAGVGADVTLAIGGHVDSSYGPPLKIKAQVRLLSDGHYYPDGRQVHQNLVQRGPIAVVHTQGADIVLSSKRIAITEPAQLRSLGIEPLAYKIVVIKLGYLHAPLQAISPRSILVLSPGPTNCDVTQLPYHRVSRPIYPIDADPQLAPG
jgi:microcystin degradation protein MlrC